MRLATVLILFSACSRLPPVVQLDSGLCEPMRSKPIGTAGFLPHGHAHNDYEHTRPLLDALDEKLYSVEADIWLRNGVIVVSHDPVTSKGALKDLYLDPLQARVDANNGSVHGDGVQFLLWIDLKESSAELRTALATMLDQYPMLTVFTDDAVTEGAVTVVLTGSESSKTAFVDERTTRRAIRDRGTYSPSDPPADKRWAYYALDYSKFMTWDGTSPTMPESERVRLQCLLGDIHAKGAKLRFWNDPQTTVLWKAEIEAGMDLIGSDDLPRLHRVLAELTP